VSVWPASVSAIPAIMVQTAACRRPTLLAPVDQFSVYEIVRSMECLSLILRLASVSLDGLVAAVRRVRLLPLICLLVSVLCCYLYSITLLVVFAWRFVY